MPKEEQDKFDKIALCKFMGKMSFVFAFSMVFLIHRDILEMQVLFTVGIALFIITMAFMLIYLNTGNRFKKT